MCWAGRNRGWHLIDCDLPWVHSGKWQCLVLLIQTSRRPNDVKYDGEQKHHKAVQDIKRRFALTESRLRTAESQPPSRDLRVKAYLPRGILGDTVNRAHLSRSALVRPNAGLA